MDSSALAKRLKKIEARLAALEAPGDGATAAARTTGTRAAPGDASPLWVLDGLRQRLAPDQGAVIYAGRYRHPAGGELQWQIGRPQQALLDEDWSDLAPRLAALGSPVRLRLLQALLQGVSAVSDLAARPGMGTSGQLYHHLRELEAAGWLHSPQRGSYALRPERVIPLMALLAAARQ
jgi:DNA-binding transcriptional ArsR family regulator